MKKALAILATVATVAATTVSAPAEARGIGPGLAFGLAAGALVAGAAAASAYPSTMGRVMAITIMAPPTITVGRTPITADRSTTGTAIGTIVTTGNH